MTVLDVIIAVGVLLAAAVEKEEFEALKGAERELNVDRSIKMLGKCRFQHAVTERWDRLSQEDFEEVLRSRCL